MKGLASAKVFAQARGSTLDPGLSLCEGEPQYHCDPLTPRSLWDRQAGWLVLWHGGLGPMGPGGPGDPHGHG